MSRTVAFKTLGCRMNQFETDALMTDFSTAGYRVVAFGEPADVTVVNTCTVTNQSDHKSRGCINQAVKRGGDDAVVVVTGCMAGSRKDYLENRHDITYVVENRFKNSILALVESHFKGELVHPAHLKPGQFDFNVGEQGLHIRSAIKIQDGCDNFCTYCIVPAVRGRAISRPVEAILEHIRKALDLGSKELVLTGVNISRYQCDGIDFDALIARILTIPGDFRIRLSSLEPEGFTDRFTRLFEDPRLCPHLHLCLQSGSDKVLLRMRRFYTVAQYRRMIDQFRDRYPLFNFTTDIIVGFPGETAADVADTLSVAEAVGFSHMHTFTYSRRAGTRAERMPDQVPKLEKQQRSRQVRALGERLKRRYRQRLTGHSQRLLVERIRAGTAYGYGEHYVPLALPTSALEVNHLYPVKLTGLSDDADGTMTAVLSSYRRMPEVVPGSILHGEETRNRIRG